MVWLLLLAGAAEAAFELTDTSWEGCSQLLSIARELLGSERVIVATTLDWQTLDASDAVLVVHPTGPLDPDEAAAFMKVGGRLGVIDDFGAADRFLQHFKLERRALPAHPSQFLRGNREFAVALPAFASAAERGPGVHPTLQDVAAVVLNHATGFDHPDLTSVLEVRGSRDASGAIPEVVAVAVAGQVEKGRLFAVGDPSAFMNSMLRYPGNRAFALGLLRYLSDFDATPPRHARLFVLVNEFDEANSFAGVTPLHKGFDRALRAAATGIRGLKSQGFPWWMHMLVAGACGIAVLAWSFRALLTLYAPRLPRFARGVTYAAQGGMAGRLAVLAAPGTPLELALLELREALVEALSAKLGKSETTPLEELLAGMRAAGSYDPATFVRAKQLASAIRAAEDTVQKGARTKLRKSQLLDACRLVDALLTF